MLGGRACGARRGVGARRLCVIAAELAAAIEDNLGRFVASGEENLGHLETQLAHQAQELLRQAAETGAQKKAAATPPVCPKCQRALTRQAAGHPRTFTTRFGEVTVRRTRGYCSRCRKWRVPADTVLGLAESAGNSTRIPARRPPRYASSSYPWSPTK